jgi:DNA polymerase-3 subunit epsilon
LKDLFVFFDLETTGTNTSTDRIVSISVLKIFPNLEKETFYSLVNPGIPIPSHCTEIHGISDEMVKDQPFFTEIAPRVYKMMNGCDLGGFNCNHFDIPLISREFSLCNILFPSDDIKVVDVGVLFKILNPRTLSAAYKFYTGEDLEGAHNAEYDNLATFKVLEKQLEFHGDLPITVQELHDKCSYGQIRLDIDNKFTKDEKGHYVFNFGKHKGQRVADNKNYLDWMIGSNFHPHTIMWANKISKELFSTQLGLTFK